MFRQGGIFSLSGFGSFDPSSFKLNFPTWQKTPQTEALQEMLQKSGFPNVKKDGIWGPCSQAAAREASGGVNPTREVIMQWFGADKLGIPAANVSAPSASGSCSDANVSKYDPNAVMAGGSPDPGLMLLAKLGQATPEGYCGRANSYPNMSTFRCECGPGFYENINTGECEQFESPQKNQPAGTNTTANVVPASSGVTRINAQPAISTRFSIASLLAGKTSQPAKVGTSANVTSTGTQTILPKVPFVPVAPRPAPGMSAGAKVAVGVMAVGAIGVIAWMLLRNREEEMIANCGCDYVPNCGE